MSATSDAFDELDRLRARVSDMERYVRELTFWAPDSENFKRIRDEARLAVNDVGSADAAHD